MVVKKKSQQDSLISKNKKARHDFHIEDTLEAGLVLEGWEVKSLRASKVQIRDAYVTIKGYEVLTLGLLITPLSSASSHVETNPSRSRKLLLNKREIDKLRGAIERRGMTAVILALYWKKNLVKAEIGIAKGKRLYDKRATEKARDWEREKNRLTKSKL
ncbi:MAG: SsrA-binding protein SmpB [Pseudomonadota bacterium]|nr:SsrA-binding protein SmpB [Pseudomonadota bacterium]